MKSSLRSTPVTSTAARRRAVALFAACLGIAATSEAANLRWDFDGDPDIGTPSVATPGSGTWSTSVANWNNTSTLLDGVWVNGSYAQFGGGGGADGEYLIIVDPSVTTLAPNTGGGGSLAFVNSGFTLQGSSAVSIAVAGKISVSPNVTATIGNNITLTGASALDVGTTPTSGTGTLIIDNGGKVSNTSDFNLGTQTRLQIKTGGTLEANRVLVTGTTTPELIVDGGTVNVTRATLFIGHSSGSQGHVELNSGAITATSATASEGYLQFGPSSGTPTASSGGTFHLNGGTLTLAQIRSQTNNAFVDAVFNFNGGTLKAKSGTTYAATFMTGLDAANVRDGGAIIDTNGQNITIGQALVHSAIDGDNAIDGGLIKRGTGTLTLASLANSFTGNITVNAGTLGLASAFINDTADVLLLTGAVLNLNYAGTDSIGSLYFDGIAQETGTYGAIGSGADFESAFFTGSGLLNVTIAAIPEPSTFAILLGVATLGFVGMRRRR